MEYAKRSLNIFYPPSLPKCVSASMSASASMTQQLFPSRTSRPKPFRVTNANRSMKKGIMADGLRDLLNKAMDAFHVSCVSALVLDEDGTGVDTEEFFQTLKENTVFMVLEKGQKWTSHQNKDSQVHLDQQQRRKDVAKLTFDLYKNHPQEFIGCLNVKATLYGMYSVSYDLHCYQAKRMLKEALRWTLFTMEATGHVLLGTSCYMQHLLDEEEKAEARLTRTNKPQQAILWRKAAV
ncbi:cell death activator CIDE-3 [Chanos chanos]|uniref:Cell death activator CIDE-3 n=1 Tax=Chanos chanos TaxID=29144 RepID=A0A6J2VJP5_CHACN|nr:cell death activator CIDE-3 [Chanos chanos]